VDIAPLLGRLVIFRSREVWHGIQPSATARRWAVTLWVLAEDGPE
jgi:Rps23 Pro-64 3,4-dihydroxylase Tpa1-like proline 4-hydroxylase